MAPLNAIAPARGLDVMQRTITAEVTVCHRDAFGRIEAIGGPGWLAEPGIVAADIIARSPDRGPYFVATPTGDEQWVTVRQADSGTHFTLSTIAGDWPLTALAGPPA